MVKSFTQTPRLKPRRLFASSAFQLQSESSGVNADQWMDMKWDKIWQSKTTALHCHIPHPTFPPPGWSLPRVAWSRLNRLRTGVGRFGSSMFKWGLASSAACECGAADQTADHVILECPMFRAPKGLRGLKELAAPRLA